MSNLYPAPIAYGIALLFEPLIEQQLIALGSELTKTFPENQYEISATFPPHLTLVLAGTDEDGMKALALGLNTLKASLPLSITIDQPTVEPTGYISLPCGSPELQPLQDAALAICSKLHQERPLYRERVLSKWDTLTSEQQAMAHATGTYRNQHLFAPHVSCAHVEPEHIDKAMAIIRSHLTLPIPTTCPCLVLVNAGQQNEKWEVLAGI